MSPAILAIIILVAILALFITEVIPLPVTAMLGAVAMAVFGIIGFDKAFAGFANDSLMMVVGMLIIGQAVYETGLVNQAGRILNKLASLKETSAIGAFSGLVGVLSGFLSNTAVTALTLPVVDSMAKSSKKPHLKALLFMPIGAAAVLGGNLTLIGSVPQLIAQGLLQDAGAPTMGFFTLTLGALPLFVIGVVYYATLGKVLLKRCNIVAEGESAEEKAAEEAAGAEEPSSQKMIISGIVFLLCVIGFVADIWTMGTVAILGALILVVTRCISLKTIVDKVDWGSVVILGGSLGFCSGLDASGAGELIARTLIDLCGGEAANPVVIFSIMVIIAAILSNIMAHTAVAAMLVPIGMFMAQSMGMSPLTMAIGIVFGTSFSVLSPIGTVPMTLTLSGGYKFVDYIKVGAPLFVILCAASCVILPVVYGL